MKTTTAWIAMACLLGGVACGSSDTTGTGSSNETGKGGTSSGGAPSGDDGGSSSGGSSSGGSSSGGSSSGGSSSGGSSSGGSSSGGTQADAGTGADAGFHCGKPGDKGNSLGVGKYCDGFLDCAGNANAPFCATLGDPNAHFCTNSCQQGSTDECGEAASCQCQNGQCGCFPDACK